MNIEKFWITKMGNSSRPNSFVASLAGFSIGPLVSAFIGFLTVPVTTWLIDPAMFGKASMFITFQSLLSLILYLGFDQAFVREFNETEDKVKLLFHSSVLPLMFSVILVVVIFLNSRGLGEIIFGEADFFSMAVLSFSIPVLIIKKFSLLIIRMEERGKLYSLLQISEKVIYLLLLFPFFFFWERTYRSIIAASFGMSLTLVVIELIITRRYWFRIDKIDFKLVTKMLKFGIPLIPVGILTWTMNSMDKVSLRIWSDYREIGLYAGAFKLVLVMDIIKRSFSNFWIPVSYRWYREKVSIKKFEQVNISLSAVLSLVYSMLVIFRKVIFLILDPSYHSASNLVPFLLFVPVMYTLSETTVLGIAFSRKTVYNLYISVVVALINMAGNYLLVPLYGALGAAVATGFSYTIFFFLRSIIGNRLWIGIRLQRSFINIGLLLALSLVTLLGNYFIEALVVLLIITLNIKEYIYVYKTIRNFTVKKLKG